LLLTLVLGSGAAMAITLTVDDDGPADHPSIQSAINAAGPGDEIVVMPGRYRETLNFLGKSITVRSDQGPENTVVFLEGETRIVLLNGDSTLRGFTITGGLNRIGGGIYVTDGAQATIEDNIIENNTARWNGVLPGVGGGIAVDLSADPVITRNVIRDNLAEGDADGVYGYGGGIHLADYTTAVITNNVVADNQATAAGGGIYLGITANGYSTAVTNNTIVGNRAGQDGSTINPEGGGIEVYDGFGGDIRNGLIAQNVADQGAGIYFVPNGDQGIDYEFNDFDANVPDDCLGLSGTKCTTGQFFLPALMQDPAGGNYRLRSDSPLVDLGTTTGAPAVDASGRSRNVDGDLDGTSAPDIGAFENQQEITRVRFDSATLLSWDGSANPGVTFDVYRDDLSTLAPGPIGSCWQPGLPTTSVTDGAAPPVIGDGFFYVVRGRDAGVGSLGFNSSGTERSPGSACP
jgi:hypothetical protein